MKAAVEIGASTGVLMRALRGACLLALLALVAGCVRAPARTAADPESGSTSLPSPPALAVETFDSAWSRIHNTYYDTTFRGVDWVAVRDELRPRAAAAGSIAELRSVIGDMLSRLGESHFQVVPAEVADAIEPDSARGAAGEPGDVGIELRVVSDELVVLRVHEGSAGERTGVRAGWVVEEIAGESVAQRLALLEGLGDARRLAEARVAWIAESRLAGSVGDTVPARFRDASGDAVELSLASDPMPGTPVRFGNLPTMFSTVEHREIATAGGCAGLIRFNVWMTPVLPRFEDALQELRHCDGMIVDLRGNPGGVAGMIMAISGYFMDEQRPLGHMITRQGEMRLVSMPRRVTRAGEPMRPYAGPLALVVDGQSMSASELFAAGLQAVDRARVFGETTGGQALPAMMVRLPNQDVLVHVFANFIDPDSVRIEGRGVVPDRLVPLRRDDLLAGRDAPVQAALRWIEDQSHPMEVP